MSIISDLICFLFHHSALRVSIPDVKYATRVQASNKKIIRCASMYVCVTVSFAARVVACLRIQLRHTHFKYVPAAARECDNETYARQCHQQTYLTAVAAIFRV
jgi:hypothetical protein